MQKNKPPVKPIKTTEQAPYIKDNSVRFLLLILFITWCAAILWTYTSRASLGSWFRNTSAVITMDKSSAFISEAYETDLAQKAPEGVKIPPTGGYFKTLSAYLVSLLLISAVLLISFSTGWKCFELLKLPFSGLMENIVFSTTLGLGILAYLTLLLGSLSALYRPVIWSIIILLAAVSLLRLNSKRDYFKENKLDIGLPSSSFLDRIFIFSGGLCLLIIFAGILAPQTWYDTLLYHFSVPQYYLIHHGIADMPFNIYSNLTGTAHMLYLLGLALAGNEYLPKLFGFSASLLVCLSIYSFCKKYFSNRLGLIGAATFCAVPLVAMEIWRSQIEIMISLFVFLSLYALVNSQKDPGQNRWRIISAVFAGLAMSSKYIGFFAFLGMTAVLAVLIIKDNKNADPAKKLRASALVYFILIALAIEAPWLAKNYVYRSNPVYPYFTNIFTSSAKFQDDKIDSLKLEVRDTRVKSVKEWLALPWDMTMKSLTESPLNGPVFLAFLPLVLLLVILKESNGVFKNFLLFFTVYYIAWSLLSFQARFLIPALPILSVIIAYALTRDPVNIKSLLPLIFIFIIFLNVSHTVTRLATLNGWRVVLGMQSYGDYLSSKNMAYNAPSYRAIEFINDNLPENSKILFWGETRAFPCRRDFIASSVHNRCPFDTWAREAKDGNALFDKLREQKVTHILWNVQETQRLGIPEVLFSQESDKELKTKLADFSTKHLEELYSTKWCRVFALKDSEEVKK